MEVAADAERRAAYARPDRVLARLGYRVLRLDAELVRRRLPRAVFLVRASLAQRLLACTLHTGLF